MCVCVIFFFQAEDGIRDLVRSRGLGDVYKRQVYDRAGFVVEGVRRAVRLVDGIWDDVVDMALLLSLIHI